MTEVLFPHAFRQGGQTAWLHDEGDEYGVFHTYDELDLGGFPPRKVHVFLPKDYERSGRRYPVVYMNDGHTAFWPGGLSGKSWRVQETLARLTFAGSMEPVIVVAVHPVDLRWRLVEYAHAPTFFFPRGGGVFEYERFLADHLKPWVDAQYPTDQDGARTALVGSSHGGLAAFIIAARRGTSFGKCAAMSPSFWVATMGSLDTAGLLAAVRNGLSVPSRPKIWISWGLRREKPLADVPIEYWATKRGQAMVAILRDEFSYRLGHDLHAHEDPIGGHDEDAWAHHLELFFKTSFPQQGDG